MPVLHVQNDAGFQVSLANAANSLAVVDFSASWCMPCRLIAPFFEELSNRYSRGVVFLKVDVDECPDTTQSQGVSSMPTFIFYRNKVKIATITGANKEKLEAKLKELAGQGGDGGEGESCPVPGHIDLISMISVKDSECLNESDDHNLASCLSAKQGCYLESEADEQLIISLAFSQHVKLHSICISAPAQQGPKTVKVFINQPRTLDFEQADGMEAVQTLELTVEDLTECKPVPLKYVKFQNVTNLQIFVKDNQGSTETTRIDRLTIIGSPISSTNMNELKRVSGKPGESHH